MSIKIGVGLIVSVAVGSGSVGFGVRVGVAVSGIGVGVLVLVLVLVPVGGWVSGGRRGTIGDGVNVVVEVEVAMSGIVDVAVGTGCVLAQAVSRSRDSIMARAFMTSKNPRSIMRCDNAALF